MPLPAAMAVNPPYELQQTLISPRGDTAALKFCQNVSVLGALLCPVLLTRPDGVAINLKHGVTGQMLWTADGKYLVGAGNNTLRLWNLSGGVRLAQPPVGPSVLHARRIGVNIQRLWWFKNDLCVSTVQEWVNEQTKVNSLQMTTVRYRVPALKALEIVSLSAKTGQDAPCHLPRTEP